MRRALATYLAYDAQAKDEGWAVFTCDDRKLYIQKLDDDVDGGNVLFKTDAGAIRFVKRQAEKGSKPHVAALRLHAASA
jgi:hypothetical protein